MPGQTSFNIIPFLLNIAAAAMGALAAGIFGVKLGFKKLKMERAFDKQLKWYTDLAETIQILKNRMNGFLVFLSQKHMHGSVPELLEDLKKLSFRFQELALLADLYTKKKTNILIKKTLVKLNAESPAFLTSSKSNDNSGKQAFIESIELLDDLFNLLTFDVRNLLGLGALSSIEKVDHLRD